MSVDRFWQRFRSLFISALFAWAIGLFVWQIINSTPLCVGQNNGDGINDIGHCTLYVLLWAVIGSAVIIPTLVISAVGAAAISRPKNVSIKTGEPI
jgi:hypothetical protein